MKKVIKLTEKELTTLVNQIVNESIENEHGSLNMLKGEIDLIAEESDDQDEFWGFIEEFEKVYAKELTELSDDDMKDLQTYVDEADQSFNDKNYEDDFEDDEYFESR